MSLDNTRKNLNIEALDDHEKKDIFDKFVKGGGQIIDDRSRRRSALALDKDRLKAKRGQNREQDRKRRQQWEEISGRKATSTKTKPVKAAKKNSFLDKMKINLQCWVKGSAPLTGNFVSAKFLRFIDGEAKNAITSLNILFIETLQTPGSQTTDTIKELDNKSPIYVELIEKIGQIYDKHELITFSEMLNKYPNGPSPLPAVAPSIQELFRKLYILRNHVQQASHAFELAIRYQAAQDNKLSQMLSRKRRRSQQDLNIIFQKLMPMLYWLFLKIQSRIIYMNSPEMDNLLEIKPEDYPGQRSSLEEIERLPNQNEPQESETSSSEEDPEKTQEKQNKVNIKELPKAIQIGLNMMKKLDDHKMRSLYDPKGQYNKLSPREKSFLSYLLFMEFDHEYSFILTTNRINLKPDFSTGSKIDFSQKLNDLFQMTHPILDNFDHYYKLTQEHQELSKENPSREGYIQHSKRKGDLENKRLAASRMVRKLIKEMMDKTAENLEVIIKDGRSNQRILANPQDSLNFDVNVEGRKKLNKQSVINALQYTYAYAMALSFRLSEPNGDLYGGSLEMEYDLIRDGMQDNDEGSDNPNNTSNQSRQDVPEGQDNNNNQDYKEHKKNSEETGHPIDDSLEGESGYNASSKASQTTGQKQSSLVLPNKTSEDIRDSSIAEDLDSLGF